MQLAIVLCHQPSTSIMLIIIANYVLYDFFEISSFCSRNACSMSLHVIWRGWDYIIAIRIDEHYNKQHYRSIDDAKVSCGVFA